MDTSHNKNLKVFAICLLAVSALSLALALLKTTGVILKPKQTEAMKGSESVGGRYLKEESYWERYGVSPEGLVLWLSQSDARSYGDSANWYDMSGQGNHGSQSTAANQPAIVSAPGLAGFARSFDGVNDYVNTVNYHQNTITVEAWIYTDFSQFEEIAARYHVGVNFSWHFYAGTDKKVSLQIYGTGGKYETSQSSALTANRWYHVVGKWQESGDNAHIYVNGVEDTNIVNSQAATTMTDSGKVIKIGARQDVTVSSLFKGMIDDVRIYNRALTAAEIKKLYLADKPRYGGM